MTEELIRERYADIETLREAISALERKTSRTPEEEQLLEDLKAYRVKYHANDKLAWYSILDIATLFDYKVINTDTGYVNKFTEE